MTEFELRVAFADPAFKEAARRWCITPLLDRNYHQVREAWVAQRERIGWGGFAKHQKAIVWAVKQFGWELK